LEMRGMKVKTARDNFTLATMRLTGLENGWLAGLLVEGFDGRSPQREAFSLARLAFTRFDMASVLRKSADMAKGTPQRPDQFAEWLTLLEGVEMDGFAAPNQGFAPGQTPRIDTFRASWGNFVGGVPSTARITAKMDVPIPGGDAGPLSALTGGGRRNVMVSYDFGGTWTEATRMFNLTPVVLEIGELFFASATLTLANVPPDVFVLDAAKFGRASEAIEAGPIELMVRDTGGVNLWIGELAKTRGVPFETARRMLIEELNGSMRMQPRPHPDMQAVVGAMARFVEAPGATIKISLSPRGSVKFGPALALAQTSPDAVLALFNIVATTTR
jgi:hypothetical protein